MAKKKSKTPKNVMKKLDITKYTPDALNQRGLSEKAIQRLYSDLRSRAMRRSKALQAKGYTDIPEANLKASTIKDVFKNMGESAAPYYFRRKIFDLVNYLNNPLSLISNQSNRTDIKTMQTLQSHGYVKASRNLKDFEKFMQAMRSRATGLMFDSERAVKLFETDYKKGSMKKLGEMFEQYMQKETETQIRNAKLLYPDSWKEKLKEMGIDYEAFNESTGDNATRSNRTARNRK